VKLVVAFRHHFVSCFGMVVIYRHWNSHFTAGESSHKAIPCAVIVRQEISQREFGCGRIRA
jgi:hypothetical protein